MEHLRSGHHVGKKSEESMVRSPTFEASQPPMANDIVRLLHAVEDGGLDRVPILKARIDRIEVISLLGERH